jgi:hypothetical protein
MRTADELIDLLTAYNEIPNTLLCSADQNMELTAEWIRFLACDEMGGRVRDDCLLEPLDYYGVADTILAGSAYYLIQKGIRPTKVDFVDRKEEGFITDLDEIAKLDSLPKMWVHWKELADRVIPADYDMRDAAEAVELFDPQGVGASELLKHIADRMDYLSDRLDPGRAYDLDNAIRFALGLGSRD